jgi:hypothetical protein
MSPSSPSPVSARSAAAVNEDIRALARAAWGRPFTDRERREYQRLRDEWVAATRTEVAAAA